MYSPLKFFCLFFLVIQLAASAQSPLVKQWDHRYGGNNAEQLNTFIITSDNGFALGGYSDSDSSGDVSQPGQGNTDFWIVKTDVNGVKQWDKRFGGTESDRLFAIIQTSDSGYFFCGYSESDSTGDMSHYSKGGADFWVVKTTVNGVEQWDKNYGGIYNDYLTCAVATGDGGLLLGGTTYSDSTGDMTHYNNGGSDYWVIKIDSLGNKQWDKNYGGNDDEKLSAMVITSDNGFILSGSSLSDSTGDIIQYSHGGFDYWIVKADSSGVLQWSKLYGGSLNEFNSSVMVAYDGGLLIGGSTFSDSTGDVSQHILGMSDYWIVKTDSAGVKQWNRRYGGDLNEQVFCNISKTLDNKYLLSGLSYSYMSGDKSEDNLGMEEPWYLKVDAAGNKIWDKTIFTNGHEETGLTLQTADSCFVTALFTAVNNAGGYVSQATQGFYDFWFVKLCDTTLTSGAILTLPIGEEMTIYPNPANENVIVDFAARSENMDFSIYNVEGKVVFKTIADKPFLINTKNIPAGIYFIKAKSLSFSTCRKLIVTH